MKGMANTVVRMPGEPYAARRRHGLNASRQVHRYADCMAHGVRPVSLRRDEHHPRAQADPETQALPGRLALALGIARTRCQRSLYGQRGAARLNRMIFDRLGRAEDREQPVSLHFGNMAAVALHDADDLADYRG